MTHRFLYSHYCFVAWYLINPTLNRRTTLNIIRKQSQSSALRKMFKIQNFGFWKSEPQKTYSAVSGDDASSESSNATNLKYGKEMRPSNDTIREDSLPRFRRPHHISKSRKFRSICLAGAATVVTITVFVLFMTLFGDKYMGRERDLDCRYCLCIMKMQGSLCVTNCALLLTWKMSVPSSSVVFEEVHGFSEPPSPETNQLWNTLLPRRSTDMFG